MKTDDTTISIDGSEPITLDEFNNRIAAVVGVDTEQDLGAPYLQVLKLAVEIYGKKAESVAKTLAELGVGDKELDSVRNLVEAGYSAITNRESEDDPRSLSKAGTRQQEALTKALAYYFAQLSKLMEKEAGLFVDPEGTANTMALVRALAKGLSPQIELAE